ncbi:uncharacterized protein LOC132023784 [Mustela nigripes]|uniref:uncharacterized protein LOC132023784 n=1 Tax=Mustela nigripes TaxID=77151 RepID=UPI002814B4F0|nr:uncharacterized protein LOC132023784 [Mustela nigripes]
MQGRWRSLLPQAGWLVPSPEFMAASRRTAPPRVHGSIQADGPAPSSWQHPGGRPRPEFMAASRRTAPPRVHGSIQADGPAPSSWQHPGGRPRPEFMAASRRTASKLTSSVLPLSADHASLVPKTDAHGGVGDSSPRRGSQAPDTFYSRCWRAGRLEGGGVRPAGCGRRSQAPGRPHGPRAQSPPGPPCSRHLSRHMGCFWPCSGCFRLSREGRSRAHRFLHTPAWNARRRGPRAPCARMRALPWVPSPCSLAEHVASRCLSGLTPTPVGLPEAKGHVGGSSFHQHPRIGLRSPVAWERASARLCMSVCLLRGRSLSGAPAVGRACHTTAQGKGAPGRHLLRDPEAPQPKQPEACCVL